MCSQRFGKATDQGASGSLLYATIGMDKLSVGRTRAIDAAMNDPQWKEEPLHIYCAHNAIEVVFTLVKARADDPAASTPVDAMVVGHSYLPVEDIVGGKQVDRWLPVCDTERRPLDGLDSVHVQVRFTDVSADPESRWGKGIGRPPVPYLGVPRTFYGQHRGCSVTLYQDAHASATPLSGTVAAGSRCWEDVFDAIAKARRLVYIAGWSIDADVALVRDPRRPAQTLGQLLKKKAGEQVAVLVLASTHGAVGEGTAVYFRGTGVHYLLCPRGNVVFAHQQKAVVVDSPRGLVGFVGGLDLCGGRYDTPEHPLFRTLGTVHHDDFHQPSFPGASVLKGGPREPWHDIHCRVEGPAARDVLDNFEQRWRKQGGGDSLLVELPRRSAVREESAAGQSAESWNVQVFRSIDSSAVAGFPEAPEEAARRGLVTGEEGAVERSIQDAYIHAIRRAKFFIYIESQYFLGSSHWWLPQEVSSETENVEAIHLIPKELSLKIASKITAGDSFRVYVVLPMWPEGEPESAPTQSILDWQRRTMEMMYRDVALAMQAKGLKGNPREYLSFFCLGNREAYSPGEYAPQERPELDSYYIRAQQARRFKINVHANTMIGTPYIRTYN
jgi:phospholipase D1/2